MYHTTGFAEDEIIDLCALVYANEENCDIDPWPPSLGLYKSVVIALTYMRRNRVQQELAETYETSQPTISRANSRITSRLAIVLAPFVPTAEDLDPDTQYIYDGTLLPCWSWREHRELYSGKTVPWQQLAEVIRNADSHRRIVWLDCCYAGLALPDKEATPDKKDPPELLEVAEVEGTYLLAAARKYEEAKSPDGEGCTAFTGELVNALRDGIAPGPPTQEFLSLNSLHQQVRSALRKKHLPEPNRHDPDNIGQLPHFHNNMTRQRNLRIGGSRAMRTRRLPSSPFRYVMGAGLGVLIVLVAVLLGTRPWAPGPSPTPSPTISASPLHGLSLTEYCSGLGTQGEGFTVARTDCVQPIKLDAACDFQYQTTSLKHRFTSSDPNSAICYNPTTHVTRTPDIGIKIMQGWA